MSFFKTTHKPYLQYSVFCFLFALVCCATFFWIARTLLPQPSQSVSAKSNTPLVIIDAGHGGEDGGAIGVNGVLEKDINLSIALQLEQMLRAIGIQTVLTRSEDKLLYDPTADYEGQKKRLDMRARLDICRQNEHAILISIHQNSFGQSQYNGLQVYYGEQVSQSKDLAQAIQTLSSETLCPQNKRNIKSGSDIYLLEHSPHPSVLVECGFLSNPEECKKLSDETYQKQIAILLTASLLNFLEEYPPFPLTAS